MKRILIVDDDVLFLESLLRMFHPLRDEWSITTAANGCEALEAVSRLEFGAVLTDLMMPEKEGLETIRALKGLRPDLPVIAMSGGGSYGVDCLQAAKMLGARSVLHKPFDFEELVAHLHEIMGQTNEPGRLGNTA